MLRKEFISMFSKGVGCFTVAATLPFQPQSYIPLRSEGMYHFPQGLASGDPTNESVVLWTRVLRTDHKDEDIEVYCQVSVMDNFSSIVAEIKMEATKASDYTVRLIVHNLEPDTKYYYRFKAGDDYSDLIGETRTAPLPDQMKEVNFAFASCQSYEGGFYQAYRTLLNEDATAPDNEKIDFILHLGDFIYETLGYGNARKLPPFPSGGGSTGDEVEWASTYAETLEDYRHLYKQYLTDPDLREARAKWPFIVIWDDHEFTDDSWQGMSTYTASGEPAQKRKYAANQAWFEFIPAHLTGYPGSSGAYDFKEAAFELENAPFEGFNDSGINDEKNNLAAIDSLRIYRNIRWGKLLELVLTDSRSYRTPHPIPGELNTKIAGTARFLSPLPLVEIFDAGKTYNSGNPPEVIPMGDTQIPNTRKEFVPGTMLGSDQKKWWKELIQTSDAHWKVWGHSVPVMPMRLDLDKINPDAFNTVFTIDTWDGYQTERRELLSYVKEKGIKNFVSLAGDNHNSFAGLLDVNFEDDELDPIGAEFCICGISSTSVFKALTSFVDKEDPLRSLIAFDATPFGGNNKQHPSLNMTFRYGCLASATLAKTGDVAHAKTLKNPNQNPHLRYVDSSAYGIGVIKVTRDKMTTRFITIEEPITDRGMDGGNVLRETTFELPSFVNKGDSLLNGPQFVGIPPFPEG